MNALTNPLLIEVEKIASEQFGGHYTIFKFSTNYKGFFGTPDGDTLRTVLENSSAWKSLNDLLYAMISNPKYFNAYEMDEREEKYKKARKPMKLDELRRRYNNDQL